MEGFKEVVMLRKEAIQTWKISLPIILGELSQMALHIIDSAMVGRINYKQLAASSLVNSVMNIPFVFGIGITISVAQMVSASHGRKDGFKISHYLFNGFWLCTVTGIIIALGLDLGTPVLFHLKQDPEVATLATPYMRIMSWSLLPMLMFMALKQFTDGLEKTRTAMLLSLIALPLNVLLNWLFIYGNWGFPRLELRGAAIGTLITRTFIFIALASVVFTHPLFRKYIAVRKNQWKLKKQTIRELLHIGIPSSLQLGLEVAAFAVSGIMIGAISAVDQAAHQIAISCAAFAFMTPLGLGQGASIRISNAWGRKDKPAIASIAKGTLLTGIVYGICCATFFSIFRKQLALSFNNDVNVVTLAATLLLAAAIFQISDAIQALSAGMLRGIKDVKVPTIYVSLAYWAVGIPVGYLLAFHFHLGAIGSWIGFIAGLSFSAVMLSIRLLKKIKE